jgi:hypothetical protein
VKTGISANTNLPLNDFLPQNPFQADFLHSISSSFQGLVPFHRASSRLMADIMSVTQLEINQPLNSISLRETLGEIVLCSRARFLAGAAGHPMVKACCYPACWLECLLAA